MGGMFGGKGSAPSPPPVTAPPKAEIDEMLLVMMAQMGDAMAQMATPKIPDTPSIIRDPETDRTEKSKELAAKAKADYTADAAKKKGRSGTILTSPLLDDDAPTTDSLLGGKTR